MPRLRLTGIDDCEPPADVLPFPKKATRSPGYPELHDTAASGEPFVPDPQLDALCALAEVNRRMEDLARALGCAGYFDDEDDDRPTAA